MDAKFDPFGKGFGKGASKIQTHRQQLSIGVLSAVLLLSCMPDPLDVTDLKSPAMKIVVSSLILPDRSVAILITKSIGALEASKESDPRELISDIAINDAEVTITVNDSIYSLKLLQDGVYQGFGIPLVAGRECHLKVVSQKFGRVSATTVVQAPIYFDTVKAEPYINEYNDYWAEVTYTIKDPPSPNYYLVNVQGAKRKDLVENILKPDAYTRQVEDKTFDEQEFSEMFRAMNRNFYPGDSIEVSLSNVSVDYFNYVSLRLENKLELVEVFSEPIYYPTNIRGGLGFFTLHLTDVRVIVL
jgi:anthranilate/para-aminobenzoate synthase component I